MSWLLLTKKALYLMKGGRSEFLDKVELEYSQNKIKINSFPSTWFSSTQFPKVLTADLNRTSEPERFQEEIIYLRSLEFPVSPTNLEEISNKSNSLKSLTENFYDEVIVGLTNDFFRDESIEIKPVEVGGDANTIKTPFNFPTYDVDMNIDRSLIEYYSFSYILFYAAWNSGFTIRPYLNTLNTNTRQAKLVFVPFPDTSINSTSSHPSSETLEKALKVQTFKTEKTNGDYPELSIVKDTLIDIWKIPINCSVDLLNNPISINFGEQKVCLTQVLDSLSLTQDAVWDWQKDAIFIKRKSQ